jgi:hypothetical protein
MLPTGGKIITSTPSAPIMKMSREDAVEALAKIRSQYLDIVNVEQYTALVMGIFGTGKTTLLRTARKPIIINSFDPTGTLVLRRLIQSGDVFVRPYWNEVWKHPTEYKRWETDWNKDMNSGFLKEIGTYCIDTATTFISALVNWWCTSRKNVDSLPYLNDYPGIYALFTDIIKRTASTGVDFILTGHLSLDPSDDISKQNIAQLHTYKGLRTEIPILFTEKYVIHADGFGDKVDYQLLTAPKGRFHASTQLGGDGLLNPIEKPDIKHILKKVGMSYEDKEIFKDVIDYINKKD